jgi:pimeloyl-ACP methyl ester carboxylesterase
MQSPSSPPSAAAVQRKRRWPIVVLALVAGLAALVGSQVRRDVPPAELEAQYATGASRFADVGGLRVHYRDEGQGPALILLHGTGSSLHTWDGWTAALARNHRVLRMDLPGFGLTGPSREGDYSIPAFVAFVEAFRAKVAVESASVAGNSLGGLIAWSYAVAHPERVRDLILVDPAGYPIDRPVLLFRLASTPVLSGLMALLDPGPLVDKTLRDAYGDASKITPDLKERYRRLSLRAGNRDAFVARARTPYVDHTADLRGLRTRTLVQWGREDRLIPVSHAARFGADIPGAKVIVYDGVGHAPMEEIAGRSAADAEAFLAAAPAGPR